MPMRMSIASKLAISLAVGPLILLVVGFIVYRSTQDLLQARDWYAHTQEVLRATAALRAELLRVDATARRYLLVGDESYLEPYRAAAANAPVRLDAVATLTADNPEQQDRIAALRPLIAERLSILADTIETRRTSGLPAALALPQTEKGRAAIAQIEATIDDIEADETQLLRAREAASDAVAKHAFSTIIFGTLASFIALAIVGFLVIRSITGPVRHAVNALASSTAEILAGTTQQAAGTQEQAAAVAQTVTTVDEIVQTAEQANERVRAVADASRRAMEVSHAGQQAVVDSITVMGTVKQQTESTAVSIVGLAEKAQSIGEIIAVVKDIAEQTNLLALNAAIEASRAGDHGTGFGVVAGEIKALAEQSKKATTQIRQILGEIQKATNSAVVATEQGTKSVEAGMRTVNRAGDTIRSLAETIADSAQAAAQITASVGQQSVGMTQIQQAMQSISQTTNQNLASTRQAERAAQDLDALGLRLKNLLVGAA